MKQISNETGGIQSNKDGKLYTDLTNTSNGDHDGHQEHKESSWYTLWLNSILFLLP